MMKRNEELKKEFMSAKSSSEEMLKLFTEMESCFKEDELGLECLMLADQLHKDGFPEKVILFGKRALKILLKNPSFNGFHHTCQEHVSSVPIAFVLLLLSNACFELIQYENCLNYLNWANKNMSKVELDMNSSCGGRCVLSNILSIQRFLFKLKALMGRKDESVAHLIRILEISELLMEEGCIELGVCNKNVYEAYLWSGDSKEALPYCLKALEIFEKQMGSESVEVAKMMGDLALIYDDLGEYVKANEQIKLARSVLRKTSSCTPDSLKEEIAKGERLIGLGKYEEAVDVLQGVVSLAPADGGERAIAFVTMARAYCDWQKFDDAVKCVKRAKRILEQIELQSAVAVTLHGEMSRLFEKMNDFVGALSSWGKTLAMPEIPQKLLAEGATRIFSLVYLTEMEKQLLPYLEILVELVKQSFGPNHSEVGYSYTRLGLAYMSVGQEELAVKCMSNAKDIMDVFHGPHHLDSLVTSQMLSVTYGIMKRYGLAVEIQKGVIEGLKGLGPSEQKFKDEAVRMLNRMKGKLAESSARASYQSKNGEDRISDDGKGN